MTDEHRAALFEAIRKRTEEMCRTPETALKALVDMGVANPDGSLTRTYGGEYTTLDEHRVPDESIQPFSGIRRSLPLSGEPDIAGPVAADQQVAADLPRQDPAGGPTTPAGSAADVEDMLGTPDEPIELAVTAAIRQETEMKHLRIESGARSGYEFWNFGTWADASEYDKVLWQGVSEAVLDAADNAHMPSKPGVTSCIASKNVPIRFHRDDKGQVRVLRADDPVFKDR